MTKRQRTAKLYAKMIRAAHPWWSAKRSRRYRSRWLEVVAVFKKRSRAAKKGARTRAVAKQLAEQQAALPKKVRDTEEWELTFRYSKKGKAIGWTMRIVAPRGTSREIIQLVARRRGQGQTEPGFRVELGNWQQELRSGRVKEFPAYEPADVPGWHALFNAGKLRIERVRED